MNNFGSNYDKILEILKLISKASVHDIHYLKDIKQQFSDCVILADKGCLSAEYQLDLFESKQIN